MPDRDDDFNSSDVEFESPPRKDKRHRGQRSIEEIIEHAEHDRISSKKAVKSLRFGRGAPGTIGNQNMWVARFNVFRQSTLRQSLERPFTGDDILRFMDSIIGKLRPGIRGKPAPCDKTAINGIAAISSYGTFTYPESTGYKLTARDGSRLQTWLDDAVKAGRLTKGKWKKRVWLNFMIVSRMAKAWLNHYERHGTQSWDLIIAKLLSIVLVASLGMRAGDVTQSSQYVGLEYLKYKDIEFNIEGDGKAKLENIRAAITLSYVKGKKDIMNDDFVLYLRPLQDPSQSHMCIVSLILIHALRHGMVRGSTIQEVLDDTIGGPDSKIIWLFPQRPVVAAIRSNKRELDLEKTTHPGQLIRTIKQMGLISNLLSPVTVHGLRYGSAQDIAHLPRTQSLGFTDESVRQTMGHAHVTLTRGTTEQYVGNHTRETYNDRAANQFEHPRGVKFSDTSALDFVNRPVGLDEIEQWRKINEPNATDKRASDRAREAIRAERHRDYVMTAPPSKTLTPSHKSAPPISTKLTSGTEINIDPRLLDEGELDSIEVDEAKLNNLLSQVLLDETLAKDPTDEDDSAGDSLALQTLLEGDDPVDQQQQRNEYDFITHFSKVNIVNCTRFAENWVNYHERGAAYAESIAKYSVQGNSRDSPTPMPFLCQATPGCPYTSLQKKAVVAHEALCSPKYVARERYRIDVGEKFACDQCEKAFLTQHLLNMHVTSIHNFVPAPCPEGCEPEKIYSSQKTLGAHIRRTHSGVWPARCLYPRCDDETKFKSSSYSNHLTKAHQLTTRAARAPFFPPTMKRHWQPTACPVDGCTNSTLHSKQNDMVKHIIKEHGYDKDAAKKLSECGWIMRLTNEVQESHLMRKHRPKPWEVNNLENEGGAEDDDDEDKDEDEDEEPIILTQAKRRRR